MAAFVAIALAYLVMLGAMAWLGVRLSLAGPMTFAQRRLRLFSAWKLTRRRFWPLLGCYLLAFVFVVIIYLVAFSLYGVITFATTGGSIADVATRLLRPDYTSLQAYLTPAQAAKTVIGGFLSALIYAVGFAPAASAYKAIAGQGPEAQAATFD